VRAVNNEKNNSKKGEAMKYPKLRAEWTPVENPNDFTGIRNEQTMKVYKNGVLFLEEEYPEWERSAEFFIPAWDSKGKLLVTPTEIMFTIQTLSPNFPSEIISSETIQLSDVGIDNPSNLEVFVMSFPENYQDYEAPIVPGSGSI
tara:strand:- start:221 stop:655 length:435 start_codon:yes stop_codon:yes gene_type:complete